MMVLLSLLSSSTIVYAASKTDPYAKATLSTTQAYGYMSIGVDREDLKIMFVSSQISVEDGMTTYHPQQFSYADNSGKISGTKTPKSNYVFVRCDYSFYVNGSRKALLSRNI